MGAFSTGRAFLLPLNEKGAGHLVLFSPAHQTVFDTASRGEVAMSVQYGAIGWNRQKKVYDLTLLSLLALYLGDFRWCGRLA